MRPKEHKTKNKTDLEIKKQTMRWESAMPTSMPTTIRFSKGRRLLQLVALVVVTLALLRGYGDARQRDLRRQQRKRFYQNAREQQRLSDQWMMMMILWIQIATNQGPGRSFSYKLHKPNLMQFKSSSCRIFLI